MDRQQFSCALVYLSDFLSPPFKNGLSNLQGWGGWPGVSYFDWVSTAEFDFEKCLVICVSHNFLEPNALGKSTNSSVASKLFVRIPSMIWWIVKICTVTPSKAVLIVWKSFLDFGSDKIEKLCIINLSCYNCKSYISVVLGNSEVTFLRECCNISSICSVYKLRSIIGEVSRKIFFFFQTLVGISLRPLTFLFLIFF